MKYKIAVRVTSKRLGELEGYIMSHEPWVNEYQKYYCKLYDSTRLFSIEGSDILDVLAVTQIVTKP